MNNDIVILLVRIYIFTYIDGKLPKTLSNTKPDTTTMDDCFRLKEKEKSRVFISS
jgi:hypothetical protein